MAIARVLRADDMDKTASDNSQAFKWMALMALATPAVQAGEAGIKKIYKGIQKKKSWNSIIEANPDIDTPEMRETYDAMYSLSPSMMRHRPIAIPALRQAQDYSTQGVPMQMASSLAGSEAQLDKRKLRLAEGIMQGASSGIGLGIASDKYNIAQASQASTSEKMNMAREAAALNKLKFVFDKARASNDQLDDYRYMRDQAANGERL